MAAACPAAGWTCTDRSTASAVDHWAGPQGPALFLSGWPETKSTLLGSDRRLICNAGIDGAAVIVREIRAKGGTMGTNARTMTMEDLVEAAKVRAPGFVFLRSSSNDGRPDHRIARERPGGRNVFPHRGVESAGLWANPRGGAG